MLKLSVPLPKLLVAVTTNGVDDIEVVGVPVIQPVEALKVNPAGSDGLIDNVIVGSPLNVFGHSFTAFPSLKEKVVFVYASVGGTPDGGVPQHKLLKKSCISDCKGVIAILFIYMFLILKLQLL
jgi:hypothetical protein